MSLISCPHCGFGRIQQISTTYIQVYNGTLIHAPHVDAWQCDLCGQTFFDPDAVRRIEMLAGEAGPPPNRHVTPRLEDSLSPAPADDSAETLHPRSK